MKSLETIKIADAVGRKNKFHRPRTHLTTMEIGEISVLMFEDCNPGDVVKVQENIFSRLAPLAVPTYGSFQFKTASFFVDYYQLFRGAEGFFSGKSITRGYNTNMPYITKSDLLSIFTDSRLSSAVASPSSKSAYDFCYTVSNSTTYYYKFNSKGRWVFKILRSLGYQIPNIVSSTAQISGSPVANDKVNVLHILAFLKAYNDYMSMSQRFDVSTITSFLESVKNNVTGSNTIDASGKVSYSRILTELLNVYLQYENDYFTSCWASPNNPIGNITGETGSISFLHSPSESRTIVSSVNNVYETIPNSTVSQRALDFLRSFDNWVRRNNYSGSKDVEKIFSRFGIKPEAYKANYAHLLNSSSKRVSVGDVTSLTDSKTSDSTGMVLGDYAGKGIVDSNTGYSYRADDFGVLITLGWIAVKPVYSNGYDRSVLRLSPLDWYNPEFDGLGGNPVSKGEVFVDRKNSAHRASTENDIFGFNERYDEYRTGNLDQITGDFCIYEDMNAWHFDRTDVEALNNSGSLQAQGLAFNSVKGYEGNNIFNRIFNSEIDNSTADHFYISADFDVTKYSNIKNLNQVPELGEGEIVVPRNGNTLN